MTQTQLASMFLGSPHTLDRDDKLRGVSSQLDATIHILDGQSYNGKILGYITAKHIIEDAHKKSLEDTLETYDFVTFSDKDFSEHLEKRNRIIIPDEDDTLREFIIFEVGREKDGSSYETTVFTHASYLELRKAGVLYSDIFKGTASQHVGRTLNNTGWQPGIIEAGGNITIEREDYTNPYEFLRVIAKEFDAELRFRVEHDGNKVTGRYVDLLERIGEWRGREAEFGKDLDSIKRIEEQDIVTALLGLGPEDSDGRRIEVLVEDVNALRRWGREDEYGNLQHLVEVYEIQSDRNEMTVSDARRYTRLALDKRINEQVTYEAKIVDLENVPGMENKKIRFGDTIRIKDEKFNPPLYLEARVFEQTRSITSNAKKEVKLGDYTEFTEEEVNAIWTMLRREIRKKIDIDMLHEYAEPKKIESDTPPDIKDGENPIWVDTSTDLKTPHVVVANEWVKMSPTERDLSDADRLKTGIVDVGAVPLRTSKTGARIEWDGVNGLVQYDRDGKPMSWLDLEGNAHLANAYLSGRIEALEGFFGENMRLADGKLEIVRPDGAVWIRDGMVANDFAISGFDPHFMDQWNSDYDSADAFYPYNGFYQAVIGELDGRGRTDDGGTVYDDIRDSSRDYTIRFQRYEFVHSARYLLIGYRIARNNAVGEHRIGVYEEESPPSGYDAVKYTERFAKGQTGIQEIIIDLGKPSYEVRVIDFRIGWVKSWNDKDDLIRFRMNRIVQTDKE